MAEEEAPEAPLSHMVDGNRLTLLTGGPERLQALIDLIEGARSSLRILYYIFQADSTGEKVRDALIAAAGRGVRTSLLVDGFGSTRSVAFFRPLTESGIAFCRFSPNYGRRYLLRNHQKLAVADERRVLIGGFNVGDEYFAPLDQDGWRDIGLAVEGDGVARVADYFDDLFEWTRIPGRSTRDLRRMLRVHSVTEGKLRWLFGGPSRRLSPWARAVRRDLRSARRLDLISAYFGPTPGILRRIAGVARRRGGRARIVTAGRSDVRAAVAAARSLYWYLLKRGVEIYEHRASRMHSKLVLIDDAVHIGSANFDMRSLFLNLEMMLRVEDKDFAAAIRRFVDGEIAASERITIESHDRQRTWLNRLRWALGYFLLAVADFRITRRLNLDEVGLPPT
ncbi:MAG TPA: phosphatidylserine/phosphatidylglycerophosphate/cardiolipin synthase family protein [Allosphingosinicella sp.]|nr:phosphatidylserine/phosphatidylglycerophosphate/cardiolipin synthase family protein [Allosphingosinicella sp.]